MKKTLLALLLLPILAYANDITLISKELYTFNIHDLRNFQRVFGIFSFVETGTAGGETTELAAKTFPQVHSIEIFENNYRIAKKRLDKYPNVRLYLGDTCVLLKDMIQLAPQRRLYWLDAHCSGEGTGGIPGYNPIPTELNIIKAYGSADDVILIDDIRGMYFPDQRALLPVREMYAQIKEMNPHHEFYTIGDIVLIFNRKFYPHVVVSDLVKACSASLLFDPENQAESYLQDIVDKELFGIAASKPYSAEGEKIGKLYQRFYASSGKNGGEITYLLWKALQDLGNHFYNEAAQHFKTLQQTPFAHWRIAAYQVRALILDQRVEEAREVFQQSVQQAYEDYPVIVKQILNDGWIEYLK
ncbi:MULTISPECIES: hypothetical protein [Parachlamydia]|jgi:hypothetical protein|nr:hypothetical protein [Parachlamydia acanthamoebae]